MLSWLPFLVFSWMSPAFAEGTECVDYGESPDQLVHLESQATRGALGKADLDCLEKSYASVKEMTTKDKISRVLLVNAYAFDTRVWADLVHRHLDEVDQSDPNIAFLYSYYLHNRGVGSAEDVIHWTEVGLERKHDWTGEIYVSRVYSLLKLRAVAASMVWDEVEKKYAAAGGENGSQQDLQDEIKTQRNRTKTFAREWLDFAKAAGRDTTEALELCISAASETACSVDRSE